MYQLAAPFCVAAIVGPGAGQHRFGNALQTQVETASDSSAAEADQAARKKGGLWLNGPSVQQTLSLAGFLHPTHTHSACMVAT